MSASQRKEFFKLIEKIRKRNKKVSQDTIMKEIEEAVRYVKKQERNEANRS